jgi:nucleotidyltransferase substrate binding protein (TIGR01987 family)
MSVSIEEFEKVVVSLERVLTRPADDVVRDAAIQRFEFCIELAWKTSRKIMGTQSTAPKQVVREMVQNGLIHDLQTWFEALEKSNQTSHTYNEDLANEVFCFIQGFCTQFRQLLSNLRKQE